MKRIKEYKKLFEVEKDLDLKTLKKTYRNLVKEWHPDKYQNDDIKGIEAEEKSRKIIDAYHFLVSIAPETIATNLDEYTNTITNSAIDDYQHKGMLLEVTFTDGAVYEYFGVTKQVYIKLMNSNNINRFARRSIYSNYTYRKTKRQLEEA